MTDTRLAEALEAFERIHPCPRLEASDGETCCSSCHDDYAWWAVTYGAELARVSRERAELERKLNVARDAIRSLTRLVSDVGGGISPGDITVQPAPSNTVTERLTRAIADIGCLCLSSRCPIHGESTGLLAAALLALNESKDYVASLHGAESFQQMSDLAAELAAARAEAERLREALRQWKCRSCNGRKVETCGCDKQVCYEWCRSGQPCERCNASGLEPIARDALAEAAPEETP